MPYIIGCDVGTTNVKAVVFDQATGDIITTHSEGYDMLHPKPDWSEQDPEEIYAAACKTLKKVVGEVGKKGEISGISFSAAMHSVLAVDEQGKPLTGLIIWADNRSSEIALKLRASSVGKKIYEHNGTPIHAMTPVCKLMWLKQNEASVFRNAARFIGIKEYLVFKFTGKYLVDYSIASAMGMFNIRELKWDEYTLKKIGLKPERLSEPVSPYHIEKATNGADAGLKDGTPLIMGASDGCLANLGSGAIRAGSMAVTIGTSGAVRVSSEKAYSDPAMQTFCYLLDEKMYIVGGPSNNGAVIFEWLMTNFFPKEDYDDVIREASQISPGSEGLLFYPYLLGERAPLWSSEVRGGFSGLDIRHTRAHFARAVLEGILLNLGSIAHILTAKEKIDTVYANGGFAKSPIWVQMLADVLGIKVVLNETVETGAAGAAMVGLKALGVVKSFSDLKAFTAEGIAFEPKPDVHKKYQELSERFEKGAQLMLAHAL